MKRRVTTLPLPGDADLVLGDEIRRAIRRDNRLTNDEFRAKATAEVCYSCRAQYRSWVCTHFEPCFFCEELNDL